MAGRCFSTILSQGHGLSTVQGSRVPNTEPLRTIGAAQVACVTMPCLMIPTNVHIVFVFIDTLSDNECVDVDISMCEPLHDLKNVISITLVEMPGQIDSNPLVNQCYIFKTTVF